MRRTWYRTVVVMAWACAIESVALASASLPAATCRMGAADASRAGHVLAPPPAEWTWEQVRERHDAVSGIDLAVGLDAAGLKRSEARIGRVRLVKTVDPNRLVHLAIDGGDEPASVVMMRGRVDVAVGSRAFSITASTSDTDLLAMRQALASSPAVQTVRATVARLSSDVAASVEGADLLVSNALLASLDGDLGALARVGRRLGEWLAAPAVEARLVLETCYDAWKQEAVAAMNWVEQCYNDFEWWNVVMRDLCFVEWTLRVEAAWFEFLRCLALAPRLPGA